MKNKITSKSEKLTNSQPSVPTAPAMQTAVAAGPTRCDVATQRSSIPVNQTAFLGFSMKLIAERSGTSRQTTNEIQIERYSGYVHEGINE
jgi:hypothetical protein